MQPNDLYTIVITRFSVRMQRNSILRDKKLDWLFDINRLRHKLALLKSINIPSVQQASVLPDCHLILIDPLLPEEIRIEIIALEQIHSNVRVHSIDHNKVQNHRNCKWLIELLDISAKKIVTTHLDDDDALHRDYLRRVYQTCNQDKYHDLGFFWIGTTIHEEWDMIFSKDAPFGYRKPISDYLSQFLTGIGLSMCCINHPDAPNVLSLGHDQILNTFHKRRQKFKTIKIRFHFIRKALKMRQPLFALKLFRGFSIVIDLTRNPNFDLAGLVINHGDNLQTSRINANKDARRFIKADDFSEYSINPTQIKQQVQSTQVQ